MENHVQKWLEKGYIDEKQSSILLEDIRCEKEKVQKAAVSITVYTIGAILLGIGIISFIFANNWILNLFQSGFVKILTTLIATIVCLGCGCYLSGKRKNLAKLGDVLIFLSTILTGGTYILISKVYNLNPDDFMHSAVYLIWAITIMPLAYIFKKQSINILSVALFIFYALFSNFYDTLEILLPVAFGIFMYCAANIPFVKNSYPEFSKVYKITAIFPLFFTILFISANNTDLYGNSINCSILFLIMLAAVIAVFMANKERNDLLKIETLILSLVCFFAIRLNLTHTVIPQILWADIIIANLLIIITIATLYHYGFRLQNKDLRDNANLFLFAYILALYYELGYSYMSRALFFFIGGLILLGAGIYAERAKKCPVKDEDTSKSS